MILTAFLWFLWVLLSHANFAISTDRDTDRDGLNDDDDKCPFDRENDKDSDNMCAVEFCWDNPNFIISLSGAKCSFFGKGQEGYGKCMQYQEDGFGEVCKSCSCMCAHEAACGFDPCPADAQNDEDKDGICGDKKTCDCAPANIVDKAGICAGVDSCLLDNDADSDSLCDNVDF